MGSEEMLKWNTQRLLYIIQEKLKLLTILFYEPYTNQQVEK